MHKVIVASLAATLMLACTVRLSAAGASAEEIQKQNDFKKAYATSDKEDHLKAVGLLEGATHESTRSMLATVIQVDPYREVQIEAYKVLSQIPSRDMGVAQVMVTLFNSLKLNDVETRIGFIGAMKNSEFKYSLTEAAADFATRLRYPDLVSNYGNNNNNGTNGNKGYSGGNGMVGNGDPNVAIRKLRAEFEKYLAAFNGFTKANLAAEDKNAPQTLKAWVAANRNKLVNADKEALDKYRLEDKERMDKNNPLLPNKNKEAKEEKKEEAKDAAKDAKDEKKEDKKDLVKDALEKKDEKKPAMKKAAKDE